MCGDSAIFGWFWLDWMVLDGKLDGLRRHKSLITFILDGLDGLDGQFTQSGSEEEKGKINVIIKVRYVFSSNLHIYFQKDIK